MTNAALTDLDVATVEQHLRKLGVKLGAPVSVVDETGSTNEDALKAGAAGAAHGALFVADQQRAGRGRLGRTWHSPPGQNLYFSLLLRPRTEASSLASMTLVVGLAVAEAVGRFLPAGLVGIKWPNDVVIGGRKLAGILVEASTTRGRVDHVVVGVGLNVLQTQFAPEIEEIATSIEREAGVGPGRLEVLGAVLERLDARLATFDEAGVAPMIEELRAYDVLRGRELRVGEVEGTGDGIDEAGRLLVRTESGEVVAVNAGEVSLVR